MSVEDSPEFQAALNEACEKQYRGYLYGGNYAKAHSKDTIAATMEGMQEATGERSRLQYEFYRALDDLGDAAEAMRLLAEYLERHPESILSGRGED